MPGLYEQYRHTFIDTFCAQCMYEPLHYLYCYTCVPYIISLYNIFHIKSSKVSCYFIFFITLVL